MTDRELKKLLKNSYSMPATEQEKKFIRKYEKRSLHIGDVLKLEFRYMGYQSILTGLALSIICLLLLRFKDGDSMWIFSSILPFGAVIPTIFLSKSERCGMDEMEASCRFSLRFVRLVRLFIIGLFTMGLFLSVGLIMKFMRATSIMDYLLYVITPYLISDFFAMAVTRHWHGKDSVYGVLAVCMAGSLVPFILRELRNVGVMPDALVVIMALALLAALVRECVKYVKESENISWNLC